MPENDFFQELKRRNVYRVAITYAIVGWLIVQIGSIVLPTIHAPEWVMQTLLFFVIIGFPIALVLAWAYEMSPQGIIRTASSDTEGNLFPASKRKPFTDNASRQLAAILFSDIVGYTALMGSDEQQAFELLDQNRQLHQILIEKYDGKLLKEMGDGILASFATITDATYCAGAIQKAADDNPLLKLRIGIHEGEVVFQGNDVFGDGVNIASRIQAIAQPGGIWVSEPVSRNIHNKTGISTAFVREEVLKNVKDPVKIYEVKIELDSSPIGRGTDQSAVPPHSLFSKIKPIHIAITVGMLIVAFLVNMNFSPGGRADAVIEHGIAVLPFDNFSEDKEKNQYLCDGFMEEIINHLSRIDVLPIITRSDVEQYREAKPARPEIGHQLGISHLLEGNLQRIGDSLKVDVRIFLAKESQIIWQDSYYRKMADLFKMQSSIAKDVAEQLEIQLTAQEKTRIETPPTENMKAWDTYITANQYFHIWYSNHLKKDYEIAIDLYQDAEAEDPTFTQPVVARASMYRFGAEYAELGQEIDMDSILILCNRAIALDSNLAYAYFLRRTYWGGLGEKSREDADLLKAWELDPKGFALPYGLFIFQNKDYIYGLQLMHQSEKFTTVHGRRRWHYRLLGHCYLQMGDTEQAWHFYDQAQFLGGPDDFYGLVSQIMLAQCLRDWDKSYELLQTFQSYYPTNKLTFGLFGSHYLQTNNYKKALGYFEHAATLSYEGRDHDWDVANFNCFHGMALWLNGKKEEGEKLINETLAAYLKLDRVRISDREVRIAGIYAFLGNKEEAYDWLRKSRWTQNALYEVKQDIWFSNINEEEEFKDIVNAVEAERLEFRKEIARLKAEGKWELK